MKDREVNHIVNRILEGRSVREVLSLMEDANKGETYKVSDIFDYATLLSIEEYEKYKSNIPKLNDWWWLRSPGDNSNIASYVDLHGDAYDDYTYVDGYNSCARPALHFKVKNPYSIGDRFRVDDCAFTVISKDYALCDDSIGKSSFRKTSDLDKMRDNWYAGEISDEEFYDYCDSIYANDYEYSDVRIIVDNWFNKNKGALIEMI